MHMKFAWLFGAILLVAAISDIVMVVNEGEMAVVLRFGKPVEVIKQPGPYLKWPRPVESAVYIDSRLKLSDSKPIEFLTQDKKNLLITPYTVWRIADPLKFIESMKDYTTASLRLSDLIISELGLKAAYMPLSAFISTNKEDVKIEELMQDVRTSVYEKALSHFGIEIVDVGLRRLTFPDQNLRHVFNRMRAERERIAKKYRAEGEEKAMQIEAETEKQTRQIIAEAKEKAAKIKGEADAEAMKIYSQAIRKDPKFYRFIRSLDAYRTIMKNNTVMILSTDSPMLKYMNPPKGNK